jgi:hypothetical protein
MVVRQQAARRWGQALLLQTHKRLHAASDVTAASAWQAQTVACRCTLTRQTRLAAARECAGPVMRLHKTLFNHRAHADCCHFPVRAQILARCGGVGARWAASATSGRPRSWPAAAAGAAGRVESLGGAGTAAAATTPAA